MKKFMRNRNFFYISLLVLLLTIIPYKAHAIDISVGATTWYSWWDWNHMDSLADLKVDPTFLYGPALSVKFNDDFNLTFIYLYGKFKVNVEGDDAGEDWKMSIKRRDSDLALNYRLNDYFKIFAGIKYMTYLFSLPMSDGNFTLEQNGIGPGLGLSAAYPMLENLFLIGNISCMYLWGDEKIVNKKQESKSDIKQYGINSSLSIAYYIEPASTVISLGGRYQYYKTAYYNIDKDDWELLNAYKDKFYGITLTATYSFSI